MTAAVTVGIYYAKKTSDNDTVDTKYGDALKVAMQFFDVQKCMFLNLSFILWCKSVRVYIFYIYNMNIIFSGGRGLFPT